MDHLVGADQNIASSSVNSAPYPHFFARNVLPMGVFAQIIKNWPKPHHMAAEGTPGVWIKELIVNHQSKIDSDPVGVKGVSRHIAPFWTYFINDVLPEIIYGTTSAYGNFVRARYDTLPVKLEVVSLMLMEVREGYFGHNVHVHHHSPEWLFTNLLYVDDYGAESRGTTLYGFDDSAAAPEQISQAGMAAMNQYQETFGNNEKYADRLGFKPVYQAPFEANGMFSFFETVYAFHSGPTMGEGRTDHARKLVRMHVRPTPGTPVRIYGSDPRLVGEVNKGNAAWLLNDMLMVQHGKELMLSDSEKKGISEAINFPPITHWGKAS